MHMLMQWKSDLMLKAAAQGLEPEPAVHVHVLSELSELPGTVTILGVLLCTCGTQGHVLVVDLG